MKKYLFLFIVTVIFSFVTRAQNLDVEINYVASDPTVLKPVIFYTPGVVLKWDDFKGKPEKNSDAAAVTNAGIGFKMSFHSKDKLATLNIKIDCNFSISESWVKKGMTTDYILTHEQHHFDITYLYAMKFVHDLKAANYTMSNYSKIIQKIYFNNQTALLAMQNQYDDETKHSQITAMQEIWNKKISSEIAALSKQ